MKKMREVYLGTATTIPTLQKNRVHFKTFMVTQKVQTFV